MVLGRTTKEEANCAGAGHICPLDVHPWGLTAPMSFQGEAGTDSTGAGTDLTGGIGGLPQHLAHTTEPVSLKMQVFFENHQFVKK